MIRFCAKKDISQKDYESALARKPLCFGKDIWETGRKAFKYLPYGGCEPYLVPVTDQSGKVVCFAYQDNEADRELRMLEELADKDGVLQFSDIFPEYQEILLCGCNELSALFAAYLEKTGINLSVTGEYWNLLGYKSGLASSGRKRMVLYAENVIFQDCSLYERQQRSVSPEFECIDKIYEANVLQNRIHDVVGSAEDFIEILKKEPEIVILGTDRAAMDAYDLLMSYGIDIQGFAVEEKCQKKLLGKQILRIGEVMQSLEQPVFINCRDSHGALGELWTEYFDYRGYKRNKQYFLMKDYFKDIPHSNLVHVLHGKKLSLTGDPVLCSLLSAYLKRMENGNIDITYTELGQKASAKQGEIRFLVMPEYYCNLQHISVQKNNSLQTALSGMDFENYTDYFCTNRAYALMDLYLNENTEKYSDSRLLPKGICLGRIPGWSGNIFLHGVMDGHPEILMLPYSDLNDNLFFYSIYLARFESHKILDIFWELYDKEAGTREEVFPFPEKFEKSAKRLLHLKERFTSQELFVLFHIAYAEMMREEPLPDISTLVIYWEPHLVPRSTFSFFALWLEDARINGQTMVLRRNNITRTGSGLARAKRGWGRGVYNPYPIMFLDDSIWDCFPLPYRHWTEFKMRFEDIKLHPEKKLMEICRRLNIAWSDNMWQTTTIEAGQRKPLAHCGSIDFDLKAVFDKYEDYLSEFDRFRLSITCSPYQKKYGYSYENCLKFSRRELQELFLKPFLFEDESIFEKGTLTGKNYEWLRQQLWGVRKHMILNDISPEFEKIEIKQTATDRMAEHFKDEIQEAVEYAKNNEKLILYGTGGDCRELLKRMDKDTKLRVLYSDRKAETAPYIFEGKQVIPPQELCTIYKDYHILVTPGLIWKNIELEFQNMGIDSSRVFYNKVKLGEN